MCFLGCWMPSLTTMSSPALGAGSPPPLIADRLVRARKGNPPQIVFSEMTEAEIALTLDCLVESNGLTDAFLLNAIGPRTRRLNLTSCYHIRKYSLGAIAQQCVNLESINLSNCRQADNKLVTNLLLNCPHLRELILDGCVRITDAAFFPPELPATVAAGLGRLTKLSLAGCRQISEEAMTRIAQKCIALTDINLAGGRGSVTGGVMSAFMDLSVLHQKLKRIDLSDCAVLSSDSAFLAYEEKLSFSTQLLPLETIKLAGLSGLPPRYTSKTVQALARMCGPHLRELETTWSSSVDDAACYVLATNCPRIRRLGICNSQVSPRGVEMLVTNLVGLESLDLSWCLKVNSTAVESIARCASSIKELVLSHCVDFLHASPTSSESGGPICPEHLSSLLTSAGANLEKLELAGLSKVVTAEVFTDLAIHCPSITHLSANLGGEDAGKLAHAFEHFGQQCEAVTELTVDVSRIQSPVNVVIEGLKYPNFPNLEKLSVTANPKFPFGDDTLEAILNNRIGLQHIELRNCAALSPGLFNNWIQGYNPDREATLMVDAMIDSELQKGYMSSASSARHTVVSKYSDSDAPTVIFRGRMVRGNRAKTQKLEGGTFNPISSCSEAETTFAGFEMLRTTIVLSDAARAMDSLKSLTLIGASRLTDASLDRLSLMTTYMQALEVLDAPLITDEAVETVRRRCRLLRSLEITGPKLRVRVDSSKFFNRRHRRKGQLPPQALVAMKRKLKDSDDDDD